MAPLGGGVIPPIPARSLCIWRGFNFGGNNPCTLCTQRTDGLRRHVRRWAHEEQSVGNDPGRRGLGRRSFSPRLRPKLDWRGQKANSASRPGEANGAWRSGAASSPQAKSHRRRCEANLTRHPGQQAGIGGCLAIPLEVPSTLRGKRSALTQRVYAPGGLPLHSDTASENRVGEFGGWPAQGSARTQQHELDGAEIRQPVTTRHLGKTRRDQLAWENRDA